MAMQIDNMMRWQRRAKLKSEYTANLELVDDTYKTVWDTGQPYNGLGAWLRYNQSRVLEVSL